MLRLLIAAAAAAERPYSTYYRQTNIWQMYMEYMIMVRMYTLCGVLCLAD